MKGIGGSTKGIIQVRTSGGRNAINEIEVVWEDVQTLYGWLDLDQGEAFYSKYYNKTQESTHIFIADYVKLDSRITTGNSRMIIDGKMYDIMVIDNPMGMKEGSHFEIYLKYTGG